MKDVLVLGSGASGLLAAWGVINAGHKVTIFTKEAKRPSMPPGVFVLHDPCRLPLQSVNVQILITGGRETFGQADAYRKKVYGDKEGDMPVSIPDDNGFETVWDGQQALGMLWDILEPFVEEREVRDWSSVEDLAHGYTYVINTIPLPVLLPAGNLRSFPAHVWIGTASRHEAYIMYNTNPSVKWYRASTVFGRFSLEFVPDWEPEKAPDSRIGDWLVADKVVSAPSDLSKLPENVLLTGRYGAWDKSKMAHDAFWDAMQWLP